MDRSNVISLITIHQTQDDTGVWRKSEMARQVYCQVDSISRAEYFEAGRDGLNPEFKFTLFFADYNNESIVVFDNKRYSVYRTYHRRNDIVELYCERKGGTVTAPSV